MGFKIKLPKIKLPKIKIKLPKINLGKLTPLISPLLSAIPIVGGAVSGIYDAGVAVQDAAKAKKEAAKQQKAYDQAMAAQIAAINQETTEVTSTQISTATPARMATVTVPEAAVASGGIAGIDQKWLMIIGIVLAAVGVVYSMKRSKD